MKLRRVALALVVLASLAHGQDTRPGGQDSRSRGTAGDRFETLAGGSAEDRLAALLWLEDSRSGSRPSWKRLFEWDDPAMRARILRGLGRTAEPDLKRALIDILTKESYALTTSEMQRAAALAVGLFGDPELLPMLAGKATPRDVAFAAGLMKMPLATALDFGTNAESRPDFDQSTFTDPVEAALRWGAVIDPPPFAELARKTLEAKDASEPRRRAAVDYFARSKAKAPADLRPALTELLRAGDPELAGLAARALAKSQGAGDAEAAAIEAAFLMTTSKVAQVDQVRALAALPVSKAFEALGHMLVLSRKEPAVLRTVLESLKAVASKLPDETRKVVAATLRPIVQPEDGETRAPADVEAAAVSLLAAADQKQFFAMLPALRLAARWQIRAAAGAALASQPEPDLNLLERFLRDPDRRTRIDVIEALAGRSSPLPAPVLEQIFHLLVKWWESYGGTGTPQHCFPLTHDPVEIAVIAKLMSATEYPAGAVYARTVLGESDLYSVLGRQ